MAKMLMLGFVVLIAVPAAMIMFPESGSRLVEKFGGIENPYSDANASWRIEGWEAQWKTVKDNIFFGDGLGSYYFWQREGQYAGVEVKAFPHNAYLQMMLKFGLFGLLLYVLLALEFFSETLRIRRKLIPGPMRAYVELGIITFGATHAYILGYGIEQISLIFFAIAIAAAKLSQPSFQASRFRTRAVRNDPRIGSQRFRLQSVPRTIRP